MNTTPTPAEFLAQPSDPEDDVDETPIDPLTSIAQSLHTIVGLLTPSGAADDLEAGYREAQEQLEQVLTICKPSTSKLANAIGAVLLPPAPVAAEAPAAIVTAPPPPPDDARVERWRSYAVGQGHDFADVGEMNRSQIRTLLGLPHTGEVSA